MRRGAVCDTRAVERDAATSSHLRAHLLDDTTGRDVGDERGERQFVEANTRSGKPAEGEPGPSEPDEANTGEGTPAEDEPGVGEERGKSEPAVARRGLPPHGPGGAAEFGVVYSKSRSGAIAQTPGSAGHCDPSDTAARSPQKKVW